MKNNRRYSLLSSQVIFFILLPLLIPLTNHLHSLVIGVAWFGFSFFCLFIVCWVTKEKVKVSIRTLHTTAFIYGGALLVLLFFRPNNQSYENINLFPFNTIHFYLSGEVDFFISLYNLGANIALFIPFGLYYRYINQKPTFYQMMLLTIGSISVIEGLQFITQRGSLDVDDLILNVLGVSVGFILYPILQKVFVLKES